MIIVEFFRDVLSGIWYFLYLLVCIIAFFYVLGIVADNKRAKINKKLKEKKTYDIESGKEAAIAAMETKQVLSVDDQLSNEANASVSLNDAANGNANVGELKKEGQEEVPQVMVLNSTEQSSTPPEVAPAVVQPAQEETQKKVEEPLVLNSSSN